MLREFGATSSPQIAGDANLDWDLPLGKFFD
jgi:hypothetical protein